LKGRHVVVVKRIRGEIVILIVLFAITSGSVAALAWQAVRPRPLFFAGLTVDRLSALLSLLVGFVGTITFRFSMRYLDGLPGKSRFMGWLFAAVCSAFVLMLADNLLVLFVAWFLTSLGLHKLLTYYPDRPEALPPARKKFLISRLGDLFLIAEIALIWRSWGTMDLHVFLARLRVGEQAGLAQIVAVLVTLAALTKSAQFPFHSWLPETMESPTPVSALMHAGIINGGGALLMRFAPLIAGSQISLVLLVLVGTLTAVLGMFAMWAQVKVKRTLAWSTVSQMGFMMVECGLAVFPAASLHIVGHGCYKAWNFLRAGSLPALKPLLKPVPPARTLALVALGVLVGLPFIALAGQATGFDPLGSPGEAALCGVFALSIGQLWAALLHAPSATLISLARRIGIALCITLIASIGTFALYHAAACFLAPVLGTLPVQRGTIAWITAALPLVAFTAVVVIHPLLPTISRTSRGQAFYVHALHGFYFGAIADRFVARIRPLPARKDAAHA
jgi:NAD(P)H-quinone oxidoreductase subunit 5